MRKRIKKVIEKLKKPKDDIVIGDKVKLRKEVLEELPDWVIKFLGGTLVVINTKGNIVSAYVPKSRNGIHRHKKYFKKT